MFCRNLSSGQVKKEFPNALCYFTQAVADSLQLPRIVLRTGGVSSFVAFTAFPSLREKGYVPIQECKLEEPVEELPPLRVKDLPMIKTEEPEKYYELLRMFVKETKGSLRVIWNSFEELESSALTTLSQEFSIPMFPIGPFHNVAAITETEFIEIAWGLVNNKHPFLWVVRLGLIKGSEWLEPLPSGFMENLEGRGLIVKWAPQLEVLAHSTIGAFWTHNGWNSTLESICEGVPMICMPCFTDQKVNARYVSHVWRVGLQLEKGVDRGEIERTIRRLMDANVERKEIRGRAWKLKEVAKVCLKQGGSSFSSLEFLVAYILSLESFTFEAS
ncbi:hypothetical protein JHK82_049234 [Glycine max]|nr:hypothetical protein JHK86_049083 [Glycine max]KAG5090456.1 hypothetical protein JHK82_049234 [Glycine max]KAG5093535.1 hypothetical protein JHK84_049123 [Glycine max]